MVYGGEVNANVLIDISIPENFSPVPADLDESTDRRYLAYNGDDKLLIMVVQEEVSIHINWDLEEMRGKVFNCSIGDHPGPGKFNKIGYCKPRNEGALHSKVSVRFHTDEPAEIKLSDIIADSIPSEGFDLRPMFNVVGREITISLPEQTILALKRLCTREGVRVDTLLSEILLEYSLRNL